MSSKKSGVVKLSKENQEISDRLAARRAASAGQAIPTPRSASRASAIDIAQEKVRSRAEAAQQSNLKAAYDSQAKAVTDRQGQLKRMAEHQKKAGQPLRGAPLPLVSTEPGDVYVVDNPTGDYLEFAFHGETIVLRPGSNEFGDNYLPGARGADIAEQARSFFGFIYGVTNTRKGSKSLEAPRGDDGTRPEEVSGAIAFPDVLRDEIAAVSNPSADERAQPFRFPVGTEHDPQGVATRATKDALIDLAEGAKDGKGKKSAKRVTGSRR